MNVLRFTHVLIVPGEEYYKNKVKEIPCRPWGKNDILQLTDVHLQLNSKTKTTVEFSAFTKIWKQNTKRVIMYIKEGTYIKFRIFHHHLLHKSLTNFCITWDHLSLTHNTIIISMDKDQHKEVSWHSFHKINPFQVNY